MTTKALPARVKATPPAEDTPEGTFEAVVATYDVDSVNDKIVPGAFRKTLGEWAKRAKSGERLPVVWSHDHGDPYSHIGEVLEASETDAGLLVKGVLDLDNPKAQQVYRLIKGGRIRNWSFAYDVRNEAATDKDDGSNLLKDLGLFEVGPTLIGANQATRTMSVKSVDTKAGRVLSSRNETELKAAADGLQDAITRLKKVLAQVTTAPESDDSQDEDPGQDTPTETDSQPESPAKAHESLGTKAQEPSSTGPDLDLLAAEISLRLKGI